MSDLAATNCGCECGGNDSSWNFSNNNWIWIIILLFSCCGGSSMCNRSNDGCGCNNWIWIIILLFLCGDNNGCGCFQYREAYKKKEEVNLASSFFLVSFPRRFLSFFCFLPSHFFLFFSHFFFLKTLFIHHIYTITIMNQTSHFITTPF